MSPTLDLDTLHLASGGHAISKNAMCVMEAVAYLAGEPWTDSPECASPVIGAFLRTWNDSSDDAQRQELKQYIPRLVGSKGTPEQEEARSWMALDWLVRVQTPTWLRLAGLDVQAGVLEGLGEVTATSCPSMLGPIQAVRKDASAAWAAAGAAAWAAAWDAAWAAAGAAAGDAAGDAAWAAAGAAAGDAAGDAAGAAAGDAAGDAARAAAGAAARAAARDAARDAAGAAARAAAGAAARDAARAALAPTVAELRVGAHQLVDRMLAVTEVATAER